MKREFLKPLLGTCTMMLCANAAFGVLLTPNTAGVPMLLPGVDFTGGTLTTASPAVTCIGGLCGTFAVGMYRETGTGGVTANPGGTLDFLYQFVPNSSFLHTLSATSFPSSLAVIDAGYLSTNPFGGPFGTPTASGCGASGLASCSPDGVSWSPNTVTFDFQAGGVDNSIRTGEISPILVIRTFSAPSGTGVNGTLTGNVFAQDGGQANALAFQPAPEPVWAGLLVAGLFAIGLFAGRSFRVLHR